MSALNWGATDSDLTRVMVGDAVVPHPNFEHTLAIDVEAEPRHVWPWLLQFGYRRGGHYSYDWLDRLLGVLDQPSASGILPQFQTLQAGDVVPFSRRTAFVVRAVDCERALVLEQSDHDAQWVWEFGVYPIAPHRTRIVSRRRAHVPDTWRWRLAMTLRAPLAVVMTRRMLLGLQYRAEQLARAAG